MWTFMTTGTNDFLEKLILRHPETDFRLMRSSQTTLVYYEDEKKKSIFAAGRKFENLYEYQTVRQFGFIVMEDIPVLKEAIPVFEEDFQNNQTALEKVSTLISARLMKEHRENNYILLTQWLNEKDYLAWKAKEETAESFFSDKTRQSAYFSSRPFTNKYHLVIDD